MTPNTAASPAAEVQNLLRFLSQDARVPLSTALSKINDLRKAKLNTPEAISKTSVTSISRVFSGDEKLAKQILAAAKRASNPKSKKRSASGNGDGQVASKRAKGPNGYSQQQSPAELEASLALPTSTLSLLELQSITVQTNRAPLFLAFAVTLLKYTMPEQPLSSRLSLAQAVVSANSRTKAKSIGLVDGKSAEDEGWGHGQPKVRVMGRMVSVMRRHGYFLDGNREDGGGQGEDRNDGDGIKQEIKDEGNEAPVKQYQRFPEESMESKELPLWGLDLEALKKLNSNINSSPPVLAPSSNKTSANANPGLPIHTPQSARSYLLKSFTQVQDQSRIQDPSSTSSDPSKPAPSSPNPPPKSVTISSQKGKSGAPPSSSQLASQKEEALSHVLAALDILFSSWARETVVERQELDRRAWDFYIRVRPDVEAGVGGWGQKGHVPLRRILELRKLEEVGAKLGEG
ncbi:hypothetical protein EPUS_00048 [Endocarpon pusillum Z07020]|uniref:Uncharacterized protein n=1 Tax=Endocarpon pusillum (strain Z07020 / HMAS-L-300199) TaxID=1263415 RepID=U1GTB7_ENDPU|nr:uncharacterized protein EPUS_00048 [Endocarpon pusillum Z07020]ERF75256.1 hypothetical protein EPUS_00048 [Endocarpon pusillum Z07020]